MLCHVPSIGSCNQFCLILQPHRVAVPFPPTFASAWRNSFVQIHGGTTLLKAIFGTTPQKRPKNDLNWGVWLSYGTNKHPLPNSLFPYEHVFKEFFVNLSFLLNITSPKRMAEQADRKSKRFQNTQNTPEREISAGVELNMCTWKLHTQWTTKKIPTLIYNLIELHVSFESQ